MRYSIILLFALALAFVSCSDDEDSCTQSDWVGTWTLDASTENCSDPNVSLNETLTVVASGDSDLIYEGIMVSPEGCSFTDTSFLPITVTLSGGDLMVNGFGCTGTYTKN